jgi:DNA-binding transcriptional ArsR family regulator
MLLWVKLSGIFFYSINLAKWLKPLPAIDFRAVLNRHNKTSRTVAQKGFTSAHPCFIIIGSCCFDMSRIPVLSTSSSHIYPMTPKKRQAQKPQRLTIELECTEDQYPVIGIRSRTKFKNFSMLYQLASEEIAKDKNMGGPACRVLFFLLGRMDYEGSVQMSQGDIGKIIGMQQSSVARAIKVLIEAGVIRVEGKPGQTATYTLNPNYGSRGKASNVVQMQRAWDGDR